MEALLFFLPVKFYWTPLLPYLFFSYHTKIVKLQFSDD